MKKLILPFLAMSCFAMLSCRFMDELKHMDAPEVSRWAPGGETQNAPDIAEVSATFTARMDRYQTESAFSLTENDEELKGDFLWDENTLRFIPFTGFKSDRSYRLIIKKTAEDEYGNSLEKEWNAEFLTGSDGSPPVFLYAEPEDFTLLTDSRQEITLVFSETPEEESFREALSVSPDMLYYIEWLDKTVKIHPLEDYKSGEEIKITVSDTLKDLAGNSMEKEVDLIYRVADKSEPEILSLILQSSGTGLSISGINNGVEKNDTISGSLNRALDEEERLNLVNLTPDSPYDLIWDGSFQNFTLSLEDLDWQCYYDLEILDSDYLLYSDGEGSRPPGVVSLAFCADGSSLTPQIQSLNGNLGASDSSTAFLDFLFSRSLTAGINQFSFMDALSLESTVLSFETTGYEVYDGTQSPAPAALPGTGESLIRIHLNISDTGLPGIVTFSLSETLADSLGNTLESPWSLTVNQP